MRRALLVVTLSLLAAAAMLVLAINAQAQLIGPGALFPCEAQLATAGGTAWTCPFGDLRGFVNIEGGTHAYEDDGSLDHGKLRLNISPGVAVNRNTGKLVKEIIALSPAPGGGTVMFAGNSDPLAAFVPGDSAWPDKGITFYRRPALLAGLLVCDPAGCLDVAERLRSLGQPPRLTPLKRRIARLERRVTRLERAVRRLSRR